MRRACFGFPVPSSMPMSPQRILSGLSSDKNEGFISCKYIITMLYLTYDDQQNNQTF